MNRVLHALLLALVVLAPLPLGSNREWSWTLCTLLAAGLAVGWGGAALMRPATVIRGLPAWIPVLFLAVCAWALVQTASWVPAEWRHPVWRLAADSLGEPLAGRISLAEDDTVTALLRLAAYALVFWLAFQLGADRARAARTLQWIAVAGFVYACYGLVVYWGEFGLLLWFQDDAFRHDVRGTFVNRNSFATYVGLAILCLLTGLYRKLALRRNPVYATPRSRSFRVEQFVLRAWMPMSALLLMVAALVLTHSRGGFASAVLGTLALLLAVHHRQRIASRRAKAAIGGALAVTVLAFVLTSEVLLQRIDRLTMDSQGRADAYQLASVAISDNPVLGFGYGTFSDSFRLYRDDRLNKHFHRAHNTYLENAFELGWPAAAALLLCLAGLAALCWRGLRGRGRDWIYPATGLAASVLVGFHALFDFSLQMPAIAMTYACIMGVACAQSMPRGTHRRW